MRRDHDSRVSPSSSVSVSAAYVPGLGLVSFDAGPHAGFFYGDGVSPQRIYRRFRSAVV